MAQIAYQFIAFAFVLFGTCILAAPQTHTDRNNLLDIETPNFFNYNSPLQQKDSLSSPQYYDFLSTLYRRDSTKSGLFRPYARSRRDAVAVHPVDALVNAAPSSKLREKRAIVFRPLFVYKQQQLRREQVQAERRQDQIKRSDV